MNRLRSLGVTLAGLLRSTRGVAMIEFAYATPVIMVMGLYGLELSSYGLANLRASQIAANLADTASRIGENIPLANKQIRESDINDAFQAVRLQSAGIDIPNRGRIILSSLERNAAGGQWIHWQRCLGRKNVVSSYGVAGAGATGTGFPGMGPPGQPPITAPPASAVMFVEVNVDYRPVVHERLLGPKVIHAKAAFLVRDRRDLAPANNPSNPAPAATRATCNLFNP
jgi:hypothetical protein